MTVTIGRAAWRGAAALTLTLAGAGQARAQAWIGAMVGNMIAQERNAQQHIDCMRGTAMPDREVAETRPSAYAAMTGYWRAAQRGGAVDATPYFMPDTKVGWTSGETRVGAGGLTRISDPFAAPDAVIGDPVGYARAGDGRSVWGQWQVRRADGSLVGTYDALFRRSRAAWRISQLKLIPAKTYPDPVVQYCGEPNDVLRYRLVTTQGLRDDEVGRAKRMRAKADQLREAALAEGASPDQRLRAADAERKAKKAEGEAKAAIYANEQAKRDAAEAEARKQAAVAALGG